MVIRCEKRCIDVHADGRLFFQRRRKQENKWLLDVCCLILINNGFSASSGPSPSIEQKAGIMCFSTFLKRKKKRKETTSQSRSLFPKRKAVIIEGDHSYDGEHHVYS